VEGELSRGGAVGGERPEIESRNREANVRTFYHGRLFGEAPGS